MKRPHLEMGSAVNKCERPESFIPAFPQIWREIPSSSWDPRIIYRMLRLNSLQLANRCHRIS